ncbi:MAG: response regulator [Rhodobacteraceae bacterium CG17_big_fil_post_rev_8_21_14_2_50_63_15]|nr:response regulator [Roseovarius sp.]PIV77229.1 MAG: response regulator [Rhodobacteraceae bacterium CG17_big_fil_post_rev_8_21_14_2_50_63_15]
MSDGNSLAPLRAPSVQRPLLGMTVLAVEDSRYASEALRLMCLRSGARIRRADCLASARRHLQVYRPSVAIIDLGLPDGSGLDLIADLDQARPRVGVILAISGDPAAEAAALDAGADGFLAKPVASLGAFQQAVLHHLPPDRCPTGPYSVSNEVIRPDPLAYRDDLDHVLSLLERVPEAPVLAYVAQFLDGVASSAGDGVLAEAAAGLTRQGIETGIARMRGLIAARLAERVAI